MSVNIEQDKRVVKFLKGMIPYYELLDVEGGRPRSIVQNTNGRMFSVFRIVVEDDKMDEDVLEERSAALAKILSSVFNHQYEFTIDYIRVRKNYDLPLVEVGAGLENANEVLRKRNARFHSTDFFENLLYFSFCFQPPRVLKESKRTILTSDILEDYLNKRENLRTGFLQCGYRAALLCENELITYLYKSFTGNFEQEGESLSIAAPCTPINDFFAKSADVYPNVYPLLINDRYHICCAPRSLPGKTFPDMFSAISKINHSVRMFVKYSCRDHSECAEPIYKQRDKEKASMVRFKAGMNAALEHREADPDELNMDSVLNKVQCDMALTHILEEEVSAGYITVNFITTMTAEEEASRTIPYKNELNNMLNTVGVLPVYSEASNTQQYFESIMIGYSGKELFSSFYCLADNAADFLPVSSSILDYKSPHLEEITHSSLPLLMGETRGSGLFRFSPSGREGNHGHTFLTGLTGGGKSVTLALMSNEWLKYPNTKVVYLDMGLSMLHTVRANGGKVFYPMVDKTAFCPFKYACDNKQAVISFLQSIAIANNFELTSRQINMIDDIVEHNLPYGEEDFETFYAIYKGRAGDDRFTDALLEYVNTYGFLFNARNDSFHDLPRICGIEFERLLTGQGKQIVYPSLVYIFNSLERLFRPEEPTLLVLDEAWRYLNNDFFASYIAQWLKQLRKKNTFVVIATQELNDLVSSPLANTIMTNCYTRIFLADEKARQPLNREFYRSIGVPEHVVDEIAHLPRFWQMVSQDNAFYPVSWLVGEELENLVTDPEEKRLLEKEERNEETIEVDEDAGLDGDVNKDEIEGQRSRDLPGMEKQNSCDAEVDAGAVSVDDEDWE